MDPEQKLQIASTFIEKGKRASGTTARRYFTDAGDRIEAYWASNGRTTTGDLRAHDLGVELSDALGDLEDEEDRGRWAGEAGMDGGLLGQVERNARRRAVPRGTGFLIESAEHDDAPPASRRSRGRLTEIPVGTPVHRLPPGVAEGVLPLHWPNRAGPRRRPKNRLGNSATASTATGQITGWLIRVDEMGKRLGFAPAHYAARPYDTVWIESPSLEFFIKGKSLGHLSSEDFESLRTGLRQVTDKPWKVHEALASKRGGLHIHGYNEYVGQAFAWGIDHYSILDEQYDWSQVVWGPGARERFEQLADVAKRGRRSNRSHVRRLKNACLAIPGR